MKKAKMYLALIAVSSRGRRGWGTDIRWVVIEPEALTNPAAKATNDLQNKVYCCILERYGEGASDRINAKILAIETLSERKARIAASIAAPSQQERMLRISRLAVSHYDYVASENGYIFC